MKKILIVFLFIAIVPITVFASSAAYVVMDADSGRVLHSFNMNSKMLIASTTKIMTAIVAIENGDLNKKYKAKEEILEVYGSMTYLKEGEELSLEDLLYGLILRSGNDCSMVIARNIGGFKKFVSLMNEKALEIGMYNTSFENPHGLDDNTKNYSTAYDLALLMRYAMKNEIFRTISSTKKYYAESNINTHEWFNKNALLTSYKYATGGKIGYTSKSKHVFVSSATKGRENLIVASIKDTDRFNTHEYLYEKSFDSYDKYQILNKYTFTLKDPNYKKFHLYIKNDFFMMLRANEKKSLKLNIVLKKKHSTRNNSKVGYIEVVLNNKILHKESIYAVNEKSKLKKIKSLLFFWK